MIGANPDGSAFYSDIIGDYAQIPNVHPVTNLPATPDYTVSNLSGLQSAISSAAAGESIEVQDGSYGNWTVTKNNTGAKIRVFCRNWHGAVFSAIDLDGAQGVSFENLSLGSSGSVVMTDQSSSASGNVDFKGVKGRNLFMRRPFGTVNVEHCVFDGSYQSVACMNIVRADGPVNVLNSIFCRAGLDIVQNYSNNTPANRITFQEVVMWGGRILNVGDPHPDIFQEFAPNSCLTFDRVAMWVENTLPGNKVYQGLFTSDGSLQETIIRNVYIHATATRKLSVNAMDGEIRDCICANGSIYGEDKNGTGDNSQLDVVNNIAAGLTAEGNAGPFKSDVGNLKYGTGNQNTVLTNATGDFSSWRDYITIDNVNNRQGQAYLESLDALWTGQPATPKNMARRVNLNVTVS